MPEKKEIPIVIHTIPAQCASLHSKGIDCTLMCFYAIDSVLIRINITMMDGDGPRCQ